MNNVPNHRTVGEEALLCLVDKGIEEGFKEVSYGGGNETVVGVEEGEGADICSSIIFAMNRVNMRRFLRDKDHKRIIEGMGVRGGGREGFTEKGDGVL